ncbi:patatin-like phospholipase family protein [Burkholderia pseudomallei]|uniref:patatin-like phospholipase family protein n=1 Tax=Burkholderia pseudomallei TaxID=28450 RepID=UPI000536770F|nr:patatin-like phospholipase family protein [Burkholderia pseudomallei]KGU75330.1 patatin-like phospholipase family protein [Burkholderia pseudomallei MSHR4304]KGV39404.1 patatin-like phospholipase family protein [Burkholderia pseudomallei MSHR4308]
MAFKILSCDGGGIRGLITALLIQDLDRRSGILAKADGFAGTSTGGLIALALARGVSISEVVDVYRNRGGEIFQESGAWLEQRATIATDASFAAFAGPGLFACQYVNTGLKRIAQELLRGGDLTELHRLTVINSSRLWDPALRSWSACTFSNASGNAYRHVALVDAALATSAAPSYFPPYEVPSLGYFADGGLFANNPSMTAVSEALASRLGGELGNLRVLSFGTGISQAGIRPSAIGDPLRWGVTTWFWPFESHDVPASALLGLTLDTTAMLATQQATQLLGGGYRRANFVLGETVGLDDWRKASLLESETAAYMKTPAWEGVCQRVDANWR